MQFIKRFACSAASLLQKVAEEGPNFYAKVNIYNFPFTVSKYDTITMHRLKDIQVGSVLKLTNVRELGSQSWTIKGRPWIDPQTVHVEALVLEHGRGAKVKAKQPKRRKGHTPLRTIKPLTTTLLIRDICVKVPENETNE